MQATYPEKLSPVRTKTGCAILIGTGLLLAAFHAGMQTPNTKTDGRGHVNLPLPTAQGTLRLSEPSALKGILATAAFHPSGSCNVGYINGANYAKEVTVERGTPIGLGGWIIDKTHKNVPAHAWIILAGADEAASSDAPITFWTSQPDVMEAFGGAPGYARAGFLITIQTGHVPVGRYHLYVKYQVGSDFYTCDNGRYVTIGSRNHG